MGKVYCLIGKSASGKSTLEKMLEKLGHNRIISYTTRPKRDGEVEGIDYHYVKPEMFQEMLDRNEFLESQEYRGWFYGVKNDLDLDNEDYICVIEPRGYFQVLEKLGKEKVVPMYVYVGDLELMKRALGRATKDSDVAEIVRRFQTDKELFDGFEKHCVYKFHNVDAGEIVQFIHRTIKSYGGR